ncbi:hypothetical protein [Labrenzia sp. CE80]|uniref:hypothetical protein n=1 Tax=Labrenzia sp. CE80 TaxID=1788986 RepID=UPI00129AAD51|nr:hypothetical protein [Labrenzia sp. CE80]
MSFMDDPEITRILDKATVLTRQERQRAIESEIEKHDGADVLQYSLKSALGVELLADVSEQDFDLAALIAWKIIYKLRASKGALH